MKRKDFNNNKEYFEYLFFEKNVLNTKSTILIISIIGIIAISSILFLSYKKTNNLGDFHDGEINHEKMIEVLVDAGYEESELKNMDEDRLISLYNKVYLSNRNQNSGDKKKDEYPENLSDILKQDYYIYASKGDFASIVSDFENKKFEYSFSEHYNKEIITIYNDAYYLNTLKDKENLELEEKVYLELEVLNSLKDPRMLLYGLLYTSEETRRDLVVDKISLSPMLANPSVRINSVESGSLTSSQSDKFKNDSRFKEVARYLNEGDYIIYKIDFTIDGNNLFAYIFKDISNSELGFYGIYAPPEVKDKYGYLTILDWIEFDKELENGSLYSSSNANQNEEIIENNNVNSNQTVENSNENNEEIIENNTSIEHNSNKNNNQEGNDTLDGIYINP